MPMGIKLGMGLPPPSAYALPDGTEPFIFADFENAVYLIDGEAATVQDILIEDNTYGTWNPATHIVPATGINNASGSSPVFTGDALTLILGGSTVVYEVEFLDASASAIFLVEMIDWPDFNTYYTSALKALSESFVGDNVAPNVEVPGSGSGLHKVAITFINGKIAWAVDGVAQTGIDPAAAWTPAPNFMAMQVNSDAVVKSIGMYPAQDDADLPTLSALA